MGWVVDATTPRLTPQERDRVPSVQEAGWAPQPVRTSAENFAPTEIRSQDRPSLSESLYRLCYLGLPDAMCVPLYVTVITVIWFICVDLTPK